MANINYGVLKKGYQQDAKKASLALKESLASDAIKAHDLDFGRLFTEFFGYEEFRDCKNNDRLVNQVFEAAGPVATTAFRDISGQIIYNMVLESYEDEEFVFTKLIPERKSNFTFEKIAGITGIGPGSLNEWKVGEGEPFQSAGVGANWINLPETTKYGKVVQLTREAIFFDRTGQVQEMAKQVGYWLGYLREMRAIDCVIDENEGAVSAAVGGHRYHWRDTSIATYGDNSGTHNWDNLAASNALVDWTDVDAAEQLLNEMVDPHTGAPIMVKADTLIVNKELEKVAQRIVGSTQIHVITPGYATSGNPTLTDTPNPYSGAFNVVSSRLLKQRTATDTTWFYGTPKKAFVYVVNFPMQTKEAPANSQLEFERDIVAQYRADERGAYGTLDPRLMVKCTA